MRLIMLDRDGVINQDSDEFIKTPDEWIPIPSSLAAIAELRRAGFTIAVATNQSGIGRGLFTETTLRDIHMKMELAVQAYGGRIDTLVYCPHAPEAGCHCRKPSPGLLEQVAERYQITLTTAVPFVGDSLRDIQAAQAAHCLPVLVRTGQGEKTLLTHAAELASVTVYDSLWDFAQYQLSTTN